MSLTHSLNNALTGLNAATRMAEVVSSNIANAMTDGYGRRTLDLAADGIAGRGAGVKILGVTRHVNTALLADRRAADAAVAGYDRQAQFLARVEGLTGEAGSDTSLAAQISAVEQALVTAGSDPSSEVRLGTVIARLQRVTDTLHAQSTGIQSLRQEADQSITEQVDQLNLALDQVQSLNADIRRALVNGFDATSLQDRRQVAIDKVAAIVPLREVPRDGGQVALISISGTILLDGQAAEFAFTPTHTITADMTIDSGGIGGLTINGRPIDARRLDGGSIGASFTLRDKTLVDAQAGLDAVARDLVERFQDTDADPTLGPADAGLLTELGARFDSANPVGLAGRLRLNAAVDPAAGGQIWRLRDGMMATAPGNVADSTQINLWLDALSTQRQINGAGPARSATGHAGAFVSQISAARIAAEDSLTFASARWEGFREAELADGVDTDAEMQNLLMVEQNYAANARIIDSVSRMLDMLMEL